MRPFYATIAVCAALMTSPEASASWFKASLAIDNTYDGSVMVFVDDRYRGTVGGDQTRHFVIDSGYAEVEVRQPGTGYLLTSKDVWVFSDERAEVKVRAPRVDALVRNTGDAPLLVDLGRHESVWVTPGSAVHLPIRAGSRQLVTQVHTSGGLREVETRTVWVEPGKPASLTVKYDPPAPTRLLLSNQDSRSLRLLIGGRDRGTLQPGQQKWFDVRPGEVEVLAAQIGGRVLFDETLALSRGSSGKLTVSASQPARYVCIGSSCSGTTYRYAAL
jgi:hypothetical protein